MPHPRLAFHSWPAAIYAIGDVHGCFEQLLSLEGQIVADGSNLEGEKWLVTVGDHIDRGSRSREVIAHVMGPAPAGFRRLALLGNHEAMALDFLARPSWDSDWLDQGGVETLASYGIATSGSPVEMAAEFPGNHRVFLENLALYLSLPGWLFVHAGLRPGVPLADQKENDLVWIRAPFLTSQLTGGLRIVHGHTPGRDIVMTPHRIDIDTGCFATGVLSAVRITPDGRTVFFSAEA